MKKICIIVAIILVFSSIGGVVSAESVAAAKMEGVLFQNLIIPYYDNINSIHVDLSFEGNKAVCMSSVYPHSTHSASATLGLYKKINNKWSIVASWSGFSSNGNILIINKEKQVSSGTYKLSFTGKVGNESFSKSVIRTK